MEQRDAAYVHATVAQTGRDSPQLWLDRCQHAQVVDRTLAIAPAATLHRAGGKVFQRSRQLGLTAGIVQTLTFTSNDGERQPVTASGHKFEAQFAALHTQTRPAQAKRHLHRPSADRERRRI